VNCKFLGVVFDDFGDGETCDVSNVMDEVMNSEMMDGWM
jgi:hypothetical protein